MARPTIDYLNARRAAKAAAGGAKQDHTAKYDPQYEPDAFELAMSYISAFSMWAETTRQVQAMRLGIPQTESETEIPF